MSGVSTHGTRTRCPACHQTLTEYSSVPRHMRHGNCPAVDGGEDGDTDV